MSREARVRQRLRALGEITEVDRTASSVTWNLEQRGERCGYVRFDTEANLLHVRVIHVQEKWSDARAKELGHLPKPLIGHFDVRKVGENLVCRLMLTCDPDAPNRLEAALRHFLQLRKVRVEGVLHGEAALENLKSTLHDTELPVPAGARELPGLTALGPWYWGTRFVPPFDKYELVGDGQPVEEAMLAIWDRQPFFFMSQQQHGSNTYLNLACSLGPVAVTADIQVGWYGEEWYPVRARNQLTRLFALVDGLSRNPHVAPKVLLSYSEYDCGTARIWYLDNLVPVPEEADLGPNNDDLGMAFGMASEGADR